MPFIETEEHARVKVESNQLNSNLKENIKLNLNNIEGISNSNGCISKIYEITDMSDIKIYPEDQSCSGFWQVKFNCRLYRPIEESYIIGKIIVTNQTIRICRHQMINIFCQEYSNEFQISGKELKHKPTKKSLKIDDYVIIKVKSKNISKNSSEIKVIGSLESIPTDEQIKEFFNY